MRRPGVGFARSRLRGRLALLVVPVALALALVAGSAEAQQAAPQPPDQQQSDQPSVKIDDLRSLVETIEDEAKRSEFLGNLKALIDASGAQPEETAVDSVVGGFLQRLSEKMAEIREGVVTLGDHLKQLPAAVTAAVERVSNTATLSRWGEVVGVFVAAVAIALVVEYLVRLALRRPRRALESREGMGFFLRLIMLTARTLTELVPIAAFAAVVYAGLAVLEADREARVWVLTFVNAYVVVRGVLVFMRAVFAPRAPSLRLFPMGDGAAQHLYAWVRRVTLVAVVGFFVIGAGNLLGMSTSVYNVLLRLLGLVIAVMAIIFILQNRERFARWIKGRRDGGALALFRSRIAAVWHVLAVAYVVAVYVIWAANVGDGFSFLIRATVLTALIVAVAAGVQAALLGALQRGLRMSSETRARFPELERSTSRYMPVVAGAVRVVVWVIAGFVILAAWGFDMFSWWATPSGAAMLNAMVSIVIVLIGAVFVWEFASSAIERYLRRQTEQGKATARVRTLLPLVRNALLVVLSVMVVLIVLSEIGVDIGPLLAGAGVIGLAVGFGAQKLVQDVITGAFLLFEDAISVGDVVTVAGTGGLVEGMSIRSIRLRDLSGSVHTIPFSSVDQVMNMTKEYSYYLMDIGVAYREDTDYVTEVVKTIIEEMRGEPEYGEVILEPLEVLGVDQFADSAVIIKARVKTLPIKQWMVGREFNRRMKKRFDELGIEIPFPHRTLYFGVDRTGMAPPARVRLEEGLGAAAGGAGEVEPAAPPLGSLESSPAKTSGRGVTSDLPEPDQDDDGRG